MDGDAGGVGDQSGARLGKDVHATIQRQQNALESQDETMQRAKRARPIAVLVTLGISLATSFGASTFLASLVVDAPATGDGQRFLLAGFLLAFFATLSACVRVLRPRWSSAPAVEAATANAAVGLLAGTSGLGALELLAHGAEVLGRPDLEHGSAYRLVTATAIALWSSRA